MANNGLPSNLGSNKPEDEYAKQFKINEKYLTKEFSTFVKAGIEGNNDNSTPFPHFQLADFIDNSGLIEDLRKELSSAKYFRNDNDLNSISQTVDLKSFDVEKFPFLRGFRRFMSTTVREFLKTVTGFELNNQVAITGSKYSQTDILLPHDDSLDFRKIAFVLYLTPDWKEEYGGELALYNAGETNRPSTIAKKLLPICNSLMFFPVATNTWHSVHEVLSADHQRISLNGWFHADNAKAAAPPLPEMPINRIRPTIEVTLSDVNLWINPSYIIPSEQKSIKRRFAAKSELYLEKFLNEEMFSRVLDELKNAKFEMIGPPDRRNIERLDESLLPSNGPITSLLNLFRSEAMSLLLTQWSGLKLYDIQKLNDSSSPSAKKPRLSVEEFTNPLTSTAETTQKPVEMVSNLYRLSHGSYTMSDMQMAADSKNNGFCLDVLIFIGEFESWPADAGGFISYIAVEETNEILKVPPRPNCLAIVFREPEILNFIKYINCLANSNIYYLLNCSFFGAASDEDSDESESLSSGVEDHEEEFDDNFEEEELSDVPEESGN